MWPDRTFPPVAAVDDARAWLLEFLLRAGVEMEMGSKLHATFMAAGLDAPTMRVDGFIGGSESNCPGILANVARLLLPPAEAMKRLALTKCKLILWKTGCARSSRAPGGSCRRRI